MGHMTKQQPNTMDEPGGPEAPLPAGGMNADNKNGIAGNARKDKAAHGEPTDPDFEPPIVPGDTKSTPHR
ncbi:hypothetical protein G3N95_22140 [Paraburkholderia sp. Tr-20389]|uniref:hypothetical protein n=1 Tax=Paraburkholderia sp. Tr-20389 TaxID=2703903 RepID=UPI00197E6B93|nr:hypothetical protein [Paraburkholderia sp. Tr-20389]MBN3755659.1 hypothetical protein [Paraburkholderia sp. Tr-20389]